MATDEQKAKMKQSIVDAANDNIYADDSGLGDAVNKVFGGGKVQDQIRANPADDKELSAAAMRNSDLSNPNSYASVRKALPDNAAVVLAREKLIEDAGKRNIPDWAQTPPDMSGAADDVYNKQMKLDALKKLRGY